MAVLSPDTAPSANPGSRRVPAGKSKGLVRRNAVAWAVVAPAAIAFALVIAYPLLSGIFLSFNSWDGIGDTKWVGISNYQSLFSDASVGRSLLLTLGYAAATSLGTVALAAVLAATVSARIKGHRFYRVVWFLPGVAPATAGAVFWSVAFQPVHGAANGFLGAIGLGNQHAWLADPATAIYPVIFVTIWASVGFAFLLVLGGVEQIPVSVYEAAQIDGASRIRVFFSITIPLVRPTLVIVGMLNFIGAANGFSYVYALTRGGPANSTETLPILIFNEAFQLSNFGGASAAAVVSGVILALIGVVSLRLSRSAQEASQ
jgi:ABC-type sugar transport system permease subunit